MPVPLRSDSFPHHAWRVSFSFNIPVNKPTVMSIMTGNDSIANSPLSKFMDHLALFDSDIVEVHIEQLDSSSHIFRLPVALVCHHSPVLRSIFWDESGQLRTTVLTLPRKSFSSVEAFQMVVQWMVTGDVKIESVSVLSSRPGYNGAETITRYSDFILLAHELKLHMAAARTGVRSMMNFAVDNLHRRRAFPSFLLSSPPSKPSLSLPAQNENPHFNNHYHQLHDIIHSSHILAAAQLPKGHPYRSFIADVIVIHYTDTISPIHDEDGNVRFQFAEEIVRVRSFAEDLSEAVQRRWTAARGKANVD